MKPRSSLSNYSCIITGISLLGFAACAAQFIEVRAEIEGTSWRMDRIRSQRTYTARFIVGTNLWFFEGNFAGNATHRYWFTGTNLVKEVEITSRSPELNNAGGPIFGRTPDIGERFVTVHTPLAREPLRGFAYVSWMAFCSGTFLKSPGREILLPFDISREVRHVSDEVSVFEDGLGLPKQFQLFGPEQKELCDYTVQQSTNFLGWNLPLSFKLVQHQEDNGRLKIEALGKVISVQSAGAPLVPPEVLEKRR